MKDLNFMIFFLVLAQTFVFVHLSPCLSADEDHIFNVQNYGAIGDGSSDDTQAFINAWEATCNYLGSSSTMQIPKGKTFLLKPITFGGPCKSNKITFLIDGNLTAPEEPHKWSCRENECEKWIVFEHFDGLFIEGSGTVDGQGAKWWSLSCKTDKLGCHRKPTSMVVSHSNNVHIKNLIFKDSPQMHIALESLTWAYVTNLSVKADGNSPNTDGIHIQNSQNVSITDTDIGTGDDCISIGTGSSYLSISRILCGPGHGISIGSLGRNGKFETVEFVHVRNATFRGTTNGVRIKTWQGGKGHVRDIIFEHITMYNSKFPIIIDQYYCLYKKCENSTSAVKISDVVYHHIHGTSRDKTAVKFACSESFPCKNIYMADIDLHTDNDHHDHDDDADDDDDHHHHHHHHHHGDHDALSDCYNVEGVSNGWVLPKVHCLD